VYKAKACNLGDTDEPAGGHPSSRFGTLIVPQLKRGSLDWPMDEAGFEPSVPPQEGTGSPAALIEERLSACVANCEKDGGTTSSNPLSSSGEAGELRGFEIRKTHIGNGGFQSFLLLMDQTHPI